MSVGSVGGWEGIRMGIYAGIAEFVWHSTVQKISMLVAKVEYKQKLDPDDGPEVLAFEALNKQFVSVVLKGPLFEEVLFRGLAQPMLAYGIAMCFPQLAAPALLGISQASLLSTVATAAGFGCSHMPGYEKGGVFIATTASVAGLVFGVVREKFGLAASIAAHMTANLSTGLLDTYWPEFLEFSREKELRLLSPRDRKLRLLKEAVERVNTALTSMPEGAADRVELEQFRASWLGKIEVLSPK